MIFAKVRGLGRHAGAQDDDRPVARSAHRESCDELRKARISRGGVSLPRPVAAADLAMMRRIDERHPNDPLAPNGAGRRMRRDLLAHRPPGPFPVARQQLA
jgi:hypothetical protein